MRAPVSLKSHLGSISPNFVRQAKRRRRTAFGEKNAIQFHQHTVALNWPQTVHKICAPFAKYVRCSPVAVLHKRLRILKAKKSRAKVGRNVDEIDPRWVNSFALFLKSQKCEQVKNSEPKCYLKS